VTIMDRYVVRNFLSSYLSLLLGLTGLVVFVDIVFNVDEFTDDLDQGIVGVLLKIVDYHGYRLPLYFHMLGGVMMSIAACFTFAIMLRSNELTPLVAAGMPLQRLTAPLLGCSVVLVALWLANSELVIPAIAPKLARTYQDLRDTRQGDVQCVRDARNAILSARELHARDGWLKNVHIIEPDDTGRPAHLISADVATYDPQRQTWVLTRGTRLTMGGRTAGGGLGSTITREPLDEYAFQLAPEQIRLRQSSQWADLMSIHQMNALLKGHNLSNATSIEKTRFIRFTQPLLIWILIALVVPFFLTREPANVLVAGGKALLLGGACFAVTFLAHAAAPDGYWQVVTALPVLIFGPVAVLHLANTKT